MMLEIILQNIEQLLNQGELRKALEAVEELEQSGHLETKDRTKFWQIFRRWRPKYCIGEDLESSPKLWCSTLKSTILCDLGKSEEALEIAEQVIIEAKQTKKYPALIMDAFCAKGNVLGKLGQLSESLEIIEEGLSYLEPLPPEQQRTYCSQKANLLLAKGKVLRLKGSLEDALVALQTSLLLFKEIENKQKIAEVTITMAIIYYYQGEYDLALNHCKKSLQLFKELGNKSNIARCLNTLGAVYYGKGELDFALDYYQKSLKIKKEIGNKQEIAITLNNIGTVFRDKGELLEGLQYLQKSLDLFKGLGNNQYTVYNLWYLVSISLDLNSQKQARKYLEMLQEIDDKDDNQGINQKRRLAEAMMLKTSTRTIKRGKAEELLREIVAEEITDHEVTVNAMLHLCDLLVQEMRVTNSEEVLRELVKLTNQLEEIAKEQQSYYLIAESTFLQARLALLELNIQKARELLTQAEFIAKEKGFQNLEQNISTEHDSILAHEKEWKEVQRKKIPLAELVELARVDDSLLRMLRKRNLDLPKLSEEEPIMILLISKSGISIFSKTFKKGYNMDQMNEQLVSGFLTAINDFSGRVFASSLDRARLGEYNLVMKPLENLLISCYVFKGATYPALQKIDLFISQIQKDETIWEKIIAVLSQNQQLPKKNQMALDTLAQEIFLPN
ncbi:MAG: tetratricopeptide repeat protein [Candidatus Heimdallarchaeota archaeon]|nr:tetratricopeptide repeat protein [Candidatus Heimdallarchaeota archaeon]